MKVKECVFPYEWNLADGYPARGVEPNGLKVFGTFICGGGSSMGYKLAGYDHLGGVELDPKIAAIYKANHHPQFLYTEDIRDFNKRDDLPPELFNLDILDGSPPCSTFSTVGSREKAWGKEKRFAEGQKMQRLDDLVFVYCETIAKLQPRTFILENVSGLLKGNAKAYVVEILRRLKAVGYQCQVFLLNAARMGVPQTRERTFIIGQRNDQGFKPLVLDFDCPPILFGEIIDREDTVNNLSEYQFHLWKNRTKKDLYIGDIIARLENGRSTMFTHCIFHCERVPQTIVASNTVSFVYDIPRNINRSEVLKISTFPQDYAATNLRFLCGMSVPPVMTAQIARQMFLQWFNK